MKQRQVEKKNTLCHSAEGRSFDARAASELSPIAVVSASRPCLPTVGLSPGSSVQSGCDSGTQERPNEIYTVNKGIDRCVCSVPDKRSDN